MRKLLLVTALAVWSTGCSVITYDALQYDRFITLQERLQQLKPACATATVGAKINALKADVDHMNHYAAGRVNAPEVAKATALIATMVTELAAQYEGDKSASTAYCQVKIDNINAGVTTIISGLGAQ